MKHWRQDSICLLLLVLIVAAVFWPVVCGRATLVPTDILHQLTLPLGASVIVPHIQNHYHMDAVTEVYPNSLFLYDCLHNGQSPIWNPYIWCGFPTFALSTYSLACPFNIVFALLPMPAAFHWCLMLQFMAAGVFMYLLARYWRLSTPACLLGALAYALNTEFVFTYWHATLRAFVWMPLVILFFDKALCGRSTRSAVAAGFFAALAVISGNIQTAVSVLFFMGIYAGATALVRRREVGLGRIAAVTVLASVIALLLAAIQLLPCLEFLQYNVSERLKEGRTTSFLQGLGAIPFLSTFVVPSLWGSTESFDLFKALKASAGEFQGYIGVASFALLVVALAARREPQVKVLAICAVAVVGTLVLIPFARRFLYYRFLIAYVLAAAGLAAWGLDWLLRYAGSEQVSAGEWRVRRCLWMLAGFLAVVAVGILAIQSIYTVWSQPLLNFSKRVVFQRASDTFFATETAWMTARLASFWQHYRLTNASFWLPLTCGAAAITVALTRLRGGLRKSCGAIFVGLVAVDLAVLVVRLVPMIDLETYPLYPRTVLTDTLQQSATRVYRWPTKPRLIMQDDLLMAYHVSSFGGYASLNPLTMEDMLAKAQKQTNAAALGICAVTHLLTKTNELPTDQAFELVTQDDGVRLYRNTAALPRARFASHYLNATDVEECRQIMARPDWQPQSMPIIETDRPPAPQSSTRTATDKVQIISETTTEVEIAVQNDTAGYVLLADTFYPGWRAYVDGLSKTIHRANGAQRAVFVEPGTHRVLFRYEPASIRIGGLISCIALLVCVGVWTIPLRRS